MFNRLYTDGRASVLIPVPDPAMHEYVNNSGVLRKPEVKTFAESRGINTTYELPGSTRKGYCSHFQTLQYPEDLEALLRKIDQIARTAVEESGTNMLYLVLGYLLGAELDDEVELSIPGMKTKVLKISDIRKQKGEDS